MPLGRRGSVATMGAPWMPAIDFATLQILRRTPSSRDGALFLGSGQLATPLVEWVEPDGHWRPNVYLYIQQRPGRQPRGRPITRDILRGIPVPVEGYEDKRTTSGGMRGIGSRASNEWAKTLPAAQGTMVGNNQAA